MNFLVPLSAFDPSVIPRGKSEDQILWRLEEIKVVSFFRPLPISSLVSLCFFFCSAFRWLLFHGTSPESAKSILSGSALAWFRRFEEERSDQSQNVPHRVCVKVTHVTLDTSIVWYALQSTADLPAKDSETDQKDSESTIWARWDKLIIYLSRRSTGEPRESHLLVGSCWLRA